jgi:hypothetical protein
MPKKPTKKERGKKSKGTSKKNDDSIGKSVKPRRAGMPAHDSIIAEVTFTSPKGKTYRIIKTKEKDAYDKPLVKNKKAYRGKA